MYNKNNRIIQRFIRSKLGKLLNGNFKKFFNINTQKKATKILLIAIKMNKLFHAINRPIVRRFRNNLSKIIKKNKINNNLRVLLNKKKNMIWAPSILENRKI